MHWRVRIPVCGHDTFLWACPKFRTRVPSLLSLPLYGTRNFKRKRLLMLANAVHRFRINSRAADHHTLSLKRECFYCIFERRRCEVSILKLRSLPPLRFPEYVYLFVYIYMYIYIFIFILTLLFGEHLARNGPDKESKKGQDYSTIRG